MTHLAQRDLDALRMAIPLAARGRACEHWRQVNQARHRAERR